MGFGSFQCLLFLSLLANYVFWLQPSYSCHDHERSALLQFRNSFAIICTDASGLPYDYNSKVKSWGHKPQSHHGDCCSWDGVSCDKGTGHVIGLDLSDSCLSGTFPSNSSLFRLTDLRHLDLSFNNFNSSQIPSEFGELSKLVSLDLSLSSFSGQIPLSISNLNMLAYLDLSFQVQDTAKADSELMLEDPSLGKLVRNLTRLTHLFLDLVDVFPSVPMVFTNLTFLKELSLTWCKLNGQFPTNIFHLPHLEMLHLEGNTDLVGFLPEFQPNSPLRKLGLQQTSFHGRLPSSIGQLANLETLLLDGCDFSGPIPSSLGNLTKLTELDLSGSNAFSGDLPSSLANLTQVGLLALSHLNGYPERLISLLFHLSELSYLSLNFINLGGEVPSAIANLTSLTHLDLSEAKLTGGIPDWLGNLTQLQELYMFNNDLEGPILPTGISQLANLESLNLEGNLHLHSNFEAFLKLKSLANLNLAGVKLTFLSKNVPNESAPRLSVLDLHSCNLTEFPRFLRNQDELEELDLSNNNIHGFIPQWFINITRETLYKLNLSYNFLTGIEQPGALLPWSHLEELYFQGNQLKGSLPIPPSSIVAYQVSHNQLAGRIPHEICQASSIKYLDISNNMLSGQIPNCISELSRSLFVLNLKCNNFHGAIPTAYPRSCKLRWINLSGNLLGGSMPRLLANCKNLEVLDIGHNHVNDTFPSWLGGLPKLHILVLRHNNFHGAIGGPKLRCGFHSLRIIDLSNNFHTGDLPSCLQNWDAMKLTTESQSITSETTVQFYMYTPHNGILIMRRKYDYSITITNKGNDMNYTRVLTVLRVIDFSSNKFTGRIPNFVGELRGLQVLNLSNNNVQGEIPLSLANMTDLESLDLSNNTLSGEIPQDLVQVTSLEVFNVSHNLLEGPIPQGRQFGTFDNSSFAGNPGLCGDPLSKKCGGPLEPPLPPIAMDNNDDIEEDSMFIDWIIRCLGCLCGFAVGCAFGKYLTDRNHEWFVDTFGRRRKKGPRTRGRTAAARPRS